MVFELFRIGLEFAFAKCQSPFAHSLWRGARKRNAREIGIAMTLAPSFGFKANGLQG
jgi:hypothetical protein